MLAPGDDSEIAVRPMMSTRSMYSHGIQAVCLGPANVDRHVRWVGGTVSAGDRPGGGARFVVRVPLLRPT